MADCILVVLNQTELIHQFMPYLKMTARGGEKLIFLVRTATSHWGDVESHLPMVQTGNITSREYQGLAWRFNINREKERAEQNLAAACEELRRNGVTTQVKMYAGGLSKALRECTTAGPPRLIILPANYPFLKLVKSFFSALSLSTHPNVPIAALLPSGYIERGVEP
jgi:hypothetical protein